MKGTTPVRLPGAGEGPDVTPGVAAGSYTEEDGSYHYRTTTTEKRESESSRTSFTRLPLRRKNLFLIIYYFMGAAAFEAWLLVGNACPGPCAYLGTVG